MTRAVTNAVGTTAKAAMGVIRRLEHENTELRAALKPFADKGREIPRHWRGDVSFRVAAYWRAADVFDVLSVESD